MATATHPMFACEPVTSLEWNPRTELTTITPKPNEPLEVALRRFRRVIESTGLLKELRARQFYENPLPSASARRPLPLLDCASRFGGHSHQRRSTETVQDCRRCSPGATAAKGASGTGVARTSVAHRTPPCFGLGRRGKWRRQQNMHAALWIGLAVRFHARVIALPRHRVKRHVIAPYSSNASPPGMAGLLMPKPIALTNKDNCFLLTTSPAHVNVTKPAHHYACMDAVLEGGASSHVCRTRLICAPNSSRMSGASCIGAPRAMQRFRWRRPAMCSSRGFSGQWQTRRGSRGEFAGPDSRRSDGGPSGDRINAERAMIAFNISTQGDQSWRHTRS